jgi:hypothetical protein
MASWIEHFLSEKNLDEGRWALGDRLGNTHIIEAHNVIAQIETAPKRKQEFIKKVLTKLDLEKVDINGYLRLLAWASVQRYYTPASRHGCF